MFTYYRFAVIFQSLGLGKDDTIHLIVGNHNHSFGACGGIWILGGVTSCGDIALDDKAIAGQVLGLTRPLKTFEITPTPARF
jgi:hypothetical protein